MIAARRSAARSARLEPGFAAGSFGDTTLGTLTEAALIVTRPFAGFDGMKGFGRGFSIFYI
jgi:hypothetical protein